MFMYLLPVVTSTKDYYTVAQEKRERERERDQRERLEREREGEIEIREREGGEGVGMQILAMAQQKQVGCLSCTHYLSHDNSQNNPSNGSN